MGAGGASAPGALEAAALALAEACDWCAAAPAFEAAAEACSSSTAVAGAAPGSSSRTAALWEMAAQAWLEGGEARAAHAAALAATVAAPEWGDAWATLGHAARNAGHFADAAAALRRAGTLLSGADAAAALEQADEAEALLQLQHARGLPMRQGVELRLLEPAAWAAPACPHSAAACGNTSAVDGPACRVWEAGIVLSRWLARGAAAGAPELATRRVLDLGAGTGVAGLAAASLGARVTLSDVEESLPLLRRNADANAPLLATCGGAVDAVTCCSWERPPAELADVTRWEVLLAADCVYSDAQLSPFVALVARLMRRDRPGGAPDALLLAHKDRDAGVTAALLAALAAEAGLSVDEVPFESHDDAFRTRSVRLFVCTPAHARGEDDALAAGET
jgi:tetratricopeptide (TPR) repeat protein